MSAKDWADLGDNRVGPLMMQMAEAIEETSDPALLSKISSRLKFMSGAVNSQRQLQELSWINATTSRARILANDKETKGL